MTISLTPKDLDILHSLTLRLRVMTVRQISQLWWPRDVSRQAVLRRLTQLQSYGYLKICLANIHPTWPVEMPLLNWSPGEPTPNFDVVSNVDMTRWCRPSVSTTVCIASESAGALMGCNAGHLPSAVNLDRELRLGSVYVHTMLMPDRRTGAWTGKRGLPTALRSSGSAEITFLDSAMNPIRALDAAGRWSPRRFESLHNDCVHRGLAYEVW